MLCTPVSSSRSTSPVNKSAAIRSRPLSNALTALGSVLLLCSCTTINNRSFDFSAVQGNPFLEQCDSRYTVDYLANHAIFVDHDGKPLRYGDCGFTDNYHYSEHLDRMFGNLEKFHERNSAAGKPTKVLIFIHGGLNSLKGTLKRASDLTCRIFNPFDPSSHYPILVNWDSEAFGSLRDHLFLVRQGEVRKVTGPLTFPLIALEDLGKSAVGAPTSWYYQYFATDLRSLIFPDQPYDHACPERYRTMASGYVNAVNALYCAEKEATGEHVRISLDTSAEHWSQAGTFGKAFSYLVTAPSTKLVLTPFIAGMGRPAWEIMVRRTTSMFTPPTRFDIRGQLSGSDSYATRREHAEAANEFRREGAVAKLLERLNSFSKGHPELEVTLVGHSMGTIVIGNILRDAGAIKNVPIRNIVFMAAACSIRDLQSAVIPYLQSCEGQETKFFNLTLHPINDADEIDWAYLDLLPRGSLLEWIDNFYTTPETHLDRTLGKWTNIIQAINIIPEEVRDRVTIKGFGLGDTRKYGPQKHGDFDEYSSDQEWKFWDEGFWEAGRYYHPTGHDCAELADLCAPSFPKPHGLNVLAGDTGTRPSSATPAEPSEE